MAAARLLCASSSQVRASECAVCLAATGNDMLTDEPDAMEADIRDIGSATISHPPVFFSPTIALSVSLYGRQAKGLIGSDDSTE